MNFIDTNVNTLKVIELEGYLPIACIGKLLIDFFNADVELIKQSEEGNAVMKDLKMLHKSKRNSIINIKKDKEIFINKIKDADILLESYKPGTLENKLNINPKELLIINSKLIILRLSGYGYNNNFNLVDNPGHDINYISYSGLIDKYTSSNNMSTIRLIPPHILYGDISSGVLISFLKLTNALIKRKYTSKGCIIQTSIAENSFMLSYMLNNFDYSLKNNIKYDDCYTLIINKHIDVCLNNKHYKVNKFILSLDSSTNKELKENIKNKTKINFLKNKFNLINLSDFYMIVDIIFKENKNNNKSVYVYPILTVEDSLKKLDNNINNSNLINLAKF